MPREVVSFGWLKSDNLRRRTARGLDKAPPSSVLHVADRLPKSTRAGDWRLGFGDCWTWTAIETDSNLLFSSVVGARRRICLMLMDVVRGRLANRVQRTNVAR
jgi:hypothetical protein